MKTVKCKCKEWMIRDDDFTQKPPNYFIVEHMCDEITIYQEKKGFRRFYELSTTIPCNSGGGGV